MVYCKLGLVRIYEYKLVLSFNLISLYFFFRVAGSVSLKVGYLTS